MSEWYTQSLVTHLLILPVILPLLAGILMLLFEARGRQLQIAISVITTLLLLATSIILLCLADAEGRSGILSSVYLLGNWSPSFGIVLVLDPLSALMLLLTSILALATLIFSLARWHRAGVYFHPLFQFLLMGLNGTFLTGDIFNLFVFFEVMLAASYGLLLHGSGARRVKAGMHYIAINLAASFLFLIGVSLIYGVTGTLNMADLALRVAQLAPEDRLLLESGAAILGVAFLVKAGIWPLSFWLPTSYTAATPPVAAMFAIMSKVGIYVILRLWLLVFSDAAGGSAQFGSDWMFYGGIATITFGMICVLASQDTARLASFSVLVSSGTLLAALSFNQVSVTAGALFYMVSSTLTLSAFYLLIPLVERGRTAGADIFAVTREAFGLDDDDDTEQDEEVGIVVPVMLAVLGVTFLACAVLLAGLPPLSGFLAKFILLTGLLNSSNIVGEMHTITPAITPANWVFIALLILSGLTALIAMTRAGMRHFWPAFERQVPRVSALELAPVTVLLFLCVLLTFQAGPVMRYMESAAQALHQPAYYIQGIMEASPAHQKLADTDSHTLGTGLEEKSVEEKAEP